MRATPAPSPAVVPIVVDGASTAKACIGIHLPNGLKVTVAMDLDPARLVPLIRALCTC